ncbi:hypothetical protein MKX08_003173 [Trichoderma sp. CBMAI-0020]|nr:hypothetical protein MKX08_003173 [Trichoderma sp. CBMAI-0020]
MRTRTDMEAKELLYGKVASDKNLYFDASHFAGKSVDQVVDFIEKLSKAGGFKDTLSYVNLPALMMTHEKGDAPCISKGFESEIRDKTNGKVKIEKKIHTSTVISNIKSGDDQDAPEIGISDGPPQQVWVERMEDFRRSMISIYRALNNKIKI